MYAQLLVWYVRQRVLLQSYFRLKALSQTCWYRFLGTQLKPQSVNVLYNVLHSHLCTVPLFEASVPK